MHHTCSKHPDREGVHYCAKYNRYLCEECLACQDPTLYCKHRQMCMIWELVKQRKHDAKNGTRATSN